MTKELSLTITHANWRAHTATWLCQWNYDLVLWTHLLVSNPIKDVVSSWGLSVRQQSRKQLDD